VLYGLWETDRGGPDEVQAAPVSAPSNDGKEASPPSLVEPLTDREAEVLGLLASGRTNREIAADLFVTVGTIKAHTSNIYAKLQARNRTEALARTRELGLLGRARGEINPG
jgi:ATP/maltotriose-dependent transcriptional regulator MalT